MGSETESKRPLGITILMIWFVVEGIFYFYTNSIDGIFGGNGILYMFGESFLENSLIVYGLGLALSNFFIVWAFMERKPWIRFPAIVLFIITAGISVGLTLLGYHTVFEIIISSFLSAIVVIYLMTPNAKKYFAQKGMNHYD